MKINIDDFKKIELKIGKVEFAEKIEDTKLIKLIVNLGDEKRTIVAGIGERYGVEDLLGQLIVVVTNLQEKEIRGIKSQGMLLAADSKEGPILIVPLEQVEPGTIVR
jgi:tRNA-binding protein